MIVIQPINPPRVIGKVFGADFNRHFKQPRHKKKKRMASSDDTIHDLDGNFSPERQQRFSLSDDDLHLYMSQSQQSDGDLLEKADSVKRSGKNKRPEASTARATKYSRLVSIDSESHIDLDETNSSHNQSLKLRTPLPARRISACSTPVLAKDKSEKGLLKEILQNQKEILMAIKKNEREIRSLKTKLEEREANFKEPIKVPLQIRNAVHEAYASGLDRGMAWQFDKKRFGDQSNDKMTDFIKSYVQGIYPTVDCLVLKAGMTRYYTTQKETEIRKTKNKLDEHKLRQMRYERKKEKSKRRLTALEKKESWSAEKKAKLRKVLDKSYMISDEEGADGGLISHPPSWESDTFQKVKEILDKKYIDICSSRSKRLLLKRTRGIKKVKDTPDVPEESKWIIAKSIQGDEENNTE